MGSTLQDQFLKMGLVDKKQADSVKKSRHEQKKNEKESPKESRIQAQEALVAKKERSRQLNQTKNMELRERETAARIRQLIDSNRLPATGGDTPYKFTDNNKVKRLFLADNIVEQLSRGALAIVRQAGEYRIIPANVAETVQQFNKNLVVVYHIPLKNIPSDHEDPYAGYQVPDDLMW
jgi:uncharacterized protein